MLLKKYNVKIAFHISNEAMFTKQALVLLSLYLVGERKRRSNARQIITDGRL